MLTVPVHEVVVRDLGAVVARVEGIAALEDFWMRAPGPGEGFGAQRVVVELVEVPFVGEGLGGPYALEAVDEFAGAAAGGSVGAGGTVGRRGLTGTCDGWCFPCCECGVWRGRGVNAPLGVLEPPLPDACEFLLEPPRYDVHGDAAVGVLVDAGDLLGCHGGDPGAGEECGDYVQFLCGEREGLRDGDRFVLVFLCG